MNEGWNAADEVTLFSTDKLGMHEELLCHPQVAHAGYEDMAPVLGLANPQLLSLSPAPAPILESTVVSAPPNSRPASASAVLPPLEDYYALQNARLQPWALRSLASSPVHPSEEQLPPEVPLLKGTVLPSGQQQGPHLSALPGSLTCMVQKA